MVHRLLLLFALVLIPNPSGAAQDQGTAKVNGTSIYYETKGKGFPLVLISGGGILDRRGWDEQYEIFAKQFRVIRYDVRGIGKSARPTLPFSHSQDLYALLKFLEIKRAHVVGLSVGGAIAIDFAIEHPEMVDGLILAAPGLSSDSKSKPNLEGLTALTNLVKTEGIEHVIQLTLDTPFVLSSQNVAAREKVRQIYLDNKDVFEAGFPLYTLWQPIDPLPEKRLGSIRARVLIIRGSKDSPDYAAMTERISKGIPRAMIVTLVGGTHFINLEMAFEFTSTVLRFLNHR